MDLQTSNEINCQLIETMTHKNNLTLICEDKKYSYSHNCKFKIDLGKIQGVKISIKELGTIINRDTTSNTSPNDVKTRTKKVIFIVCLKMEHHTK